MTITELRQANFLEDAYHFNSSDLEANKRGTLSEKQKYMPSFVRIAILYTPLIIINLSITIYATNYGIENSAEYALFVAGLGYFVLLLFVPILVLQYRTYRDLRNRYTDDQVESMRVSQSKFIRTYKPRSTSKFYVELSRENVSFKLTEWQYLVLDEDVEYCLYFIRYRDYLANRGHFTAKILSVEICPERSISE